MPAESRPQNVVNIAQDDEDDGDGDEDDDDDEEYGSEENEP
jgi:hypothetical protein